jgi:two-component system response regulator PilR (NtrC family)
VADINLAPLTGDILIVDDERSMREFLAIYLRRAGHRVEAASDGASARRALGTREFDVVITDLRMPDASGLDVLAEAKKQSTDTQVIVVTAFATAETAIAAMKAGAYDYLTKPFKVDEVGLVVDRALERRVLHRQNLVLRDEIKGRYKLDRLLGKSPAMQRVFEMVRKIAPARTSVLLIGESGTGKELAARALHELSARAENPFIAVNCGAIPETLIESELFGHVKGAFTGANADKLGLFEAAHTGTIFLDEVGELPVSMQVKLLRVLQERKVKRVGGVNEKEVDLRVVAATNRDLETEIRNGRFREDLYYRLNVVLLHLPPLRDRGDDIVVLARYMLSRYAPEYGNKVRGFTPSAIAAVKRHRWPGNIRELENRIKKAVVLADKALLGPEDLGLNPDELPPILPLAEARERWQREYINEVLALNGGNRTKTARDLGVDPRTIFRHLEKEEGGAEEPPPSGTP